MSENVWETFDGLFKSLYRQENRVAQLEQRVIYLEQLLQERVAAKQSEAAKDFAANFPRERAA